MNVTVRDLVKISAGLRLAWLSELSKEIYDNIYGKDGEKTVVKNPIPTG